MLLVDCGHELFGARILEMLRARTAAPVHKVVLTHGHVDRAFGVSALDAEAADAGRDRPRRVAHRGVARRCERSSSLMARNIFLRAAQEAEEALRTGGWRGGC